MAETTTATLYRFEIDVSGLELQDIGTRLRRWVFANKTVYDAHGNPVSLRQPKR